jgi:hypothetical protein
MNEPLAPALTLHVAATALEARQLCAQGFCPVECAFGGESILDALAMDHHGTESHREAVSIRAWRDHAGARRTDPRFVVTGTPDADATFAIAALAGLLPKPTPGGLDPAQLALRIAELDVDPFHRPATEDPAGLAVLLFNRLASRTQDATAFHAGIDRWRWILGLANPAPWLEPVRQSEIERRTLAAAARVEFVGREVAVVQSPAWGWDVWYATLRPIIVAHVESSARVSIGCRNLETARELLGPGGLLPVLARLQPAGWGGRETIGGSPRNARMTWADAVTAAHIVQEEVTHHRS